MINKLDDINKFLVLGAGTLGLRVGLQAALSGFKVSIYDVEEGSFAKAKKTQEQVLEKLIKEQRIEREEASAALRRISFTTDAELAAKDAEFINESVTERLDIKREVWKQFGELCKPGTIFTTNTSYLLPSQMASDAGRPAQFCAFHFHDVFFANVVDIMPHPETDEALIDLLYQMGLKLNQIPVILRRENPGYVFNSMLMAILGSAGHLVVSGITGVEDVDRSWMGNFKMPIGPFGILDEIGLDTAWHVTSNLKDQRSQRFADFLKDFIDEGKLGVKSGEGFYSYPKPSYKEEGFLMSIN